MTSSTSHLVVREMAASEMPVVVDYFHGATDEHLARLGADRKLLPARDDWLRVLEEDRSRPLERRSSYWVVWELDGRVVGFSRTERITIGGEAFMHLHIVEPGDRSQGHGSRFVRLSARRYFEALDLRRLYCEPNAYNVAPNRTLQRAGFHYVFTHDDAPTPLNPRQALTRWALDRPDDLSVLD